MTTFIKKNKILAITLGVAVIAFISYLAFGLDLPAMRPPSLCSGRTW
jgi:hypothetical protein